MQSQVNPSINVPISKILNNQQTFLAYNECTSISKIQPPNLPRLLIKFLARVSVLISCLNYDPFNLLLAKTRDLLKCEKYLLFFEPTSFNVQFDSCFGSFYLC